MEHIHTVQLKQNQEKISLDALIDEFQASEYGVDCTGLSSSGRAYWAARLFKSIKLPVCAVLSSAREAEIFIEDLRFFLKNDRDAVIYFSPYNILPFKFLAYHNETAANRIRALYRMLAVQKPPLIVTTVDALLQKVVPKPVLNNYAELIISGEELDRDSLIEKLNAGGYVRSAIVEEPGDYSVRGGILDLFSPLYPDPLRIDLFGDMVESIRLFSAVNQRTIKEIHEAVVLPAREIILPKAELEHIISRIRKRAASLPIPVTRVRELIDRIKCEGIFPGIESMMSMIYPKLSTLFDYIPHGTVHMVIEPAQLENAAGDLLDQTVENYLASSRAGNFCVTPRDLYLEWAELKQLLSKGKVAMARMLPVAGHAESLGRHLCQVAVNVESSPGPAVQPKAGTSHGELFAPLVNWIDDQKNIRRDVILACETHSQAKRLTALLKPYKISPGILDHFPDIRRAMGMVFICIGQVSGGFIWGDEALALITEKEIFGNVRTRKKPSKPKAQTRFLGLEDLKKDDLVVHADHGIGCYQGLVKLKLGRTTNDFLQICYLDDDKLYLPVDRMSMIQKYMGVDGIIPLLDKMGGKSWGRIKAKVKKSVAKIAGDLLKLYAARKVKKGHAYRVNEESFRNFEIGFDYEETSDQLKAIEDVLYDMSQPTPMDRLVCGDVGYGKTEVALRAAFWAVNEGKQVAVLVPTTVLAEQHFATLTDRFRQLPINIACLSRFKSSKEVRRTISELTSGKVDIVVGTHRLLSRDIRFKDIGLIVLDEEQRFGVKQKEKLKKIRDTVDVLALTATPIPRTLHMSLMGVRDISIISTPPEYRHAIITYISEFEDLIAGEAIRNELKRGGQVFFVHNNIYSIERMAGHLQKIVPEVRLDVAHGRMHEDELEKVMLRFMNKEIDLLVTTTIIESGLDIPSANTILINRADRFGLAQIYQLRGRVGRSDEQAYAYLFIPDESTLGKNARKRLKVLMEHSDLGSGFQIAMNDLKIRGGGTILGESQSGQIAAVGYDMFLKLMENTMSELKGEPVCEDLEPEINLPMSAFLSESYVSDIDQRLVAYRRLARMTALKEISDFKAEMIDRYGALPREGANLLLKIMLKVLSVKAGVKRLDLMHHQLLLYFSEIHQKNPLGIVDMVMARKKSFTLTSKNVFKAALTPDSPGGLLLQTKNILQEIAQHVNI
ncbi:MAG: transcription-repair coupling factor [Deltaproteobacteria bacterium]|nr:transcription-repair coupling factor [Deltaproteobacteria bacterium]